MQLYLIRHADAVEHPDDAARQLSPRGRDQAKALGQFLGRGGAFTPAEIWHSPLRRARETAELLAAAAKLAVPLREKAGLRPEDNPAALVPMIQRTTASVALVGHEPHLSALASLLVAGATEPPVFLMKKATVLALDGTADYWAVRWQVSPELLR